MFVSSNGLKKGVGSSVKIFYLDLVTCGYFSTALDPHLLLLLMLLLLLLFRP